MSENEQPASLDLYQEQARQGLKIDTLCDDVKEIKDCLIGREGIIVEVDRLKRGHKLVKAVCWVVFTCTMGTVATLVAQTIGK